jgi:hypothetical protein
MLQDGGQMTIQHYSATELRDVGALLAYVHQHGAPLRIRRAQSTYSILSDEQLARLLYSPQE